MQCIFKDYRKVRIIRICQKVEKKKKVENGWGRGRDRERRWEDWEIGGGDKCGLGEKC